MNSFAFPAIVGTVAVVDGICIATSKPVTRPDANPNPVALTVPARPSASLYPNGRESPIGGEEEEGPLLRGGES